MALAQINNSKVIRKIQSSSHFFQLTNTNLSEIPDKILSRGSYTLALANHKHVPHTDDTSQVTIIYYDT